MHVISRSLRHVKQHLNLSTIQKRAPVILLWGSILLVFFTNTVHESYPDEFDNMLGGWYLIHGKLIYKNFFTHHAPFAYVFSGIIELLSWNSFVKFRLIYALIAFGYMIFVYRTLAKRVGAARVTFFPFFVLLFGIAATYFWGHMVLADNLAALLMVLVYGLLALKSYYHEKMTQSDLILISIVSALVLFTSLTYLYAVAFVYLFTFVMYCIIARFDFSVRNIVRLIGIVAAPYLVLFFLLLITGALSDFWYQTIVFNQKFYIYNYPGVQGTINPIRYAIVIAQNFHNNFSSLLIGVKDLNFNFPFNITLAVANTSLLIFLVFKRKYSLAIFTLMLLVYANARSNPLESRETDYQASVYIVLSLFNLCFVLQQLYQEINRDIEQSKKIIFGFLLLVAGTYGFFNTTFLLRKYAEKTYNKYMGIQPLIYDRPEIAPVINSLVSKNEYMWIGPFEFGELFYSKGKVPSNYIILLPEFAKSPKIMEEMVQDFTKNKPKVIYFDKTYSIRGYRPEEYGGFFQKFLDENYVTLYSMRTDTKKYMSNVPITLHIDYETKLFIRKDRVNEVVAKLLETNIIREENSP